MGGRHVIDDDRDEGFPRGDQFVEADRCLRHADEASPELLGDILAARAQPFGHGARVADQIGDVGFSRPAV